MRKTNLFRFGILAITIALSIQGCKKNDDGPTEFIADDNTFKNFKNWTLVASKSGPDPFLGAAHGGNDSTVVRDIYFYENISPGGGSYPVGALIVKESKNPGATVNVRTAMAKRGNGFNPSGGDWEWFLLNDDGTIAVDNDNNPLRGSNLMNGACVGCHTAATTDFVFSK